MRQGSLTRRAFVESGALGAAALAAAPGAYRGLLEAAADPARPGPGPYGPLGPPDANGLSLPAGFRSRQIAQGGQPVEGTSYTWHPFSDGMGTFATPDGGWVVVSNSEVPALPNGGASAIRFDAGGSIVDAYRILSGTTMNCAGGVTPWGTWLSCEETGSGQVWECDPTGREAAVARPALGRFTHEAACVDPVERRLYLTEDTADAGFYRFTPAAYPDLSNGLLEIALIDDASGRVEWRRVPDPSGGTPTRLQVPGSARFQRGEGAWFDEGIAYFVTTFDSRIYAYHTRDALLELLYDGDALGAEAPVTDIDNVTVAARSGDLFVCEDIDEASSAAGVDLGIVTPDREAAKFLTASGSQHTGSELCGVCFDPSGGRMYVASQRDSGSGAVYEISGPFRITRSETSTPARRQRVRVQVLGTARLRGFLRRGLPVRVLLDRPGSVEVTLSTRVRSRRRGGAKRRVVLARERVGRGRTDVRLRLRPPDAVVARLRGRRGVRARIRVEVRTAGETVSVVRRVRLAAPRGGRRRRAGRRG